MLVLAVPPRGGLSRRLTVADYFRRLKHHPGTPWAAFLSGTGALAGRDSVRGVIIGTILMSIYWIPVLITNLEADRG